VIGVAGSVAVGKSTFARILRALLARWPDHPRVDLVTTDGFLWPNRVLEDRGLLSRKGFPESYDARALTQFLTDVKAATGAVHAPVYSHQSYDIVPGEFQVVDRPDIVIVEGLNVPAARRRPAEPCVCVGLLRLLDLHRRRRERHRAVVRVTVPGASGNRVQGPAIVLSPVCIAV
jgi:pantothenate kinase